MWALFRAHVKRSLDGWEGSYSGSPRIHNPWVSYPGGGRTQSCMCPKIVVGTYPTRGEAARVALRKKREEEREDYSDVFPATRPKEGRCNTVVAEYNKS